jgi:hypothetical protein
MSVTGSDRTGSVEVSSGFTEMEVSDVPEREERPSPQQAEQVIELTETRKSLDSFSPSPPVPVLTQMASMDSNHPGGGRDNGGVSPLAQPPLDADG